MMFLAVGKGAAYERLVAPTWLNFPLDVAPHVGATDAKCKGGTLSRHPDPLPFTSN